jgi:hypothetical protein
MQKLEIPRLCGASFIDIKRQVVGHRSWVHALFQTILSAKTGGCRLMFHRKYFLFLTALMVVAFFLTQTRVADSDDKDRERERRREHVRGSADFQPVANPAYKEQCGACHFAYQPGLLPSGSWKKILDQTAKHFDASFELDPEVKKTLLAYLTANAAEKSTAKRSARIMKSLGKSTPLRITEIPVIKDKHHKVSEAVLKRPAIGSLSNCAACHQKAEEGNYSERTVSIPK